MAKIGSARIDEKGGIKNGVAGDQTGKEVMVEKYYAHSKGWLAFYPKDETVAENLAKAMEEACANNNIGYDQNQRLGVFNRVKAGVRIKDINTPTECDCSALVRACILQATGKVLANFNTSTEPNILKTSGIFQPSFTVTKASQLKRGMILCTKTKGHTVIVTEADGITTPTQAPAPAKKSIEEIAREVIAGKWGNGTARNKNLVNAGYDYSAVQKKVNELLKGGR